MTTRIITSAVYVAMTAASLAFLSAIVFRLL